MRKLSPVAGNNVLLKANKDLVWRWDTDYVRTTVNSFCYQYSNKQFFGYLYFWLKRSQKLKIAVM